jgi:hypothetical protein
MKILKYSLRIVRGLILGILITLIPGYLFGIIGYGSTYGGIVEQLWLDECIGHMHLLRANCDDPDLQEVLDYTIQRYNKIGPFDVAVTRLWRWPFGQHAIAYNNPMIPGISLDLEVLKWSAHDGAMIVVHEALHDYYPYAGHDHITPREEKLEQLYHDLRRIR